MAARKRKRQIDEQGHEPTKATHPKWRECRKCHDVRLIDRPWRRPCPPSAANIDERTYMGE
jgi:hypothetical protein